MALCPDVALPVSCRVHRPTLHSYKPFFIEGLSVLEHVVSGYGELVSDEGLGFSRTVLALELLVVFLDRF